MYNAGTGGQSSPQLINCVVWAGGGGNIFFLSNASPFTARNCLFDASVNRADYTASDPTNLTTTTSPFASTSSAQLNPCSPAINAGLNSATGLAGVTTDLAGNTRVFGGIIDMGAYEYQGEPTRITLSNPTTITATQSVAFSQSFTVVGGSGPYSFSVVSGTLPGGLSLATTGELSGTPTQAGSYSISVRATDANGCAATGAVYSLVVTDATPAIAGLSASPAAVCAGSPVTFTATVGNVTGSYSYTLTNGSGTSIEGTSTGSTFSQDLTATGSGVQNFTLIVTANGQAIRSATSLTITSLPLAGLVSNGPLSCTLTSVTLTATGGESYTFVNSSGTVLTGSGNTRLVSTPGTYSVTVANASGCTSTTSVTVTGDTTPPSVSLTNNSTISCANTSVVLTATPGLGVYTFSAGADQQGGSLGNTATVSAGGTYSVVVTAADGCTATASTTVDRNTNLPTPSLLTAQGQPAVTVTVNSGPVTLLASGCSGTINWTGPNNTAGTGTTINVPTSQPGTFVYRATCQVGTCVSEPATATVTATATAPAAVLRVLHRDVDNYADNNAVQPMLQLVNEGSGALPLSAITLRYYLTVEGTAPLSNLSIFFAQVGDRNVSLRYVPLNPARSGASGYVEYSFSPDAGSLAAGANSGNIQSYFAKVDYSPLNELDDYSYAPVRDQLVANPRITAYDNGVLIWGQEPASGARVALPETGSELSVRVLGNPVTGDRVVFEVSDTGGAPVQLRLLSQQGHVVSQQPLAGSDRTSERCELSLAGQAAGVYMLEVSTATQRRTVKVIKAD